MSCLTPEAIKAYANATMETRHREAANLHSLPENLRELAAMAARWIGDGLHAPEFFRGPREGTLGRGELQPVGNYDER